MIEEPLYKYIAISITIHFVSLLSIFWFPPVKENKNLKKKPVMVKLVNLKQEAKKIATPKPVKRLQKKKSKKRRKKTSQLATRAVSLEKRKRNFTRKVPVNKSKKTVALQTRPVEVFPDKPVMKKNEVESIANKVASAKPAPAPPFEKKLKNISKIINFPEKLDKPEDSKAEQKNVLMLNDNLNDKAENLIDEPIPLETNDKRYAKYFETIRRKIGNTWSYPDEAAMLGLSGAVKLKFILDREGNVKDVIFVTSSGHRILDNEAVDAIKEASPYSSIPKTIKRNRLSIVATFKYFPAASSAVGGW